MVNFTHLHIHTEYSILDGACRLKPLVKHIKEMGQTAIAITDHGVMHGCIDFYKACKAEGIKPIIGCEVYVAQRTRFDKVHGLDNQRYHLVLLAKNENGYKNLIKLVSAAWTEGFYTKPRIDHDLLEQYHEDIICLSACLAGEIPQALLKGDYEGAKNTALWYKNLFGEGNYYMEIQDHGIEEQKRTNPDIIKIARELDIPLVATNDAHYVKKEDAEIQKILLCIQTKKTINEDTGMGFSTDEFYVKSGEEMLALFPEYPDAIENTNKIAEMCNVDFKFGNSILPNYDVPEGMTHFEYFRKLCYDGFVKRYGENGPQEYKDRLDYELGIIDSMGFTDYFLIVWDYINYARSVGIPVGPGRGSGAGSIAAYCVGITAIDPMRYDLLFERFLNPERVSMPDFDIDFCYVRRPEVIEYVKRKYGDDHVAQIATFGTMAAKGAVRDVGRVLGIPLNLVQAVTKEIPGDLGMTIAKALESSQDFRKLYEGDPQIKNLVDISMKIEGMVRNTGMHAAGVVICRDPVDTYVPLFKSGDSVVTQYYKGWVEALGLLKMDFLGLRTLTVVTDAEKLVREKVPDFDVYDIDIDDKETYEMLANGGTSCVFQCESAGIRSLMINMHPNCLEDIIAVIALYRPGPMDFIPGYLENRAHPNDIKYHTPELAPILDVTYGTIVYQEQVMRIFQDLAGYSLGAADMVRRAVAKKQADVLEKQRKYFLYGSDGSDSSSPCDGCVKRGITEEAANAIFDDMASFASYAFNKSHSAAYAYVTYQTAWLRCHYPCEFMAAMLTSVLSNADKLVANIAECINLGISVLPPHVNGSREEFTVEENAVRFGLLAVKNVAQSYIELIIKERDEKGPYESFYSFCKRTYGKEFNRRSVEHLIKAGALDNLGTNRNQMLKMMDVVVESLENEKKSSVSGQLGFFDISQELAKESEPEAPDVPEFSEKEILQLEKESTGIYMSGHPMTAYKDYARRIHAAKTIDLLEADVNDKSSFYKNGHRVKILTILSTVKKKVTKNNTTMAFLQAEDVTGSIEVVVFPKKMEQVADLLVEDNIVVIEGRLELSDDSASKISLDSITLAPSLERLNGTAPVSSAPIPPPDYVPMKRDIPLPTGFNSDTASSEPASVPARPAVSEKPAQPQQKKSTRGLFLRLPSEGCPEIEQIMPLITQFSGPTPVHFYYSDVDKYNMHTGISTSVTASLYGKLQNILGNSNVVLKN